MENIINRFTVQSFGIKSLSLMYVALIFQSYSNTKSIYIFAVLLISICTFAYLDAKYLKFERVYRKIEEFNLKNGSEEINVQKNYKYYIENELIEDEKLSKTFLSWSIWPVYTLELLLIVSPVFEKTNDFNFTLNLENIYYIASILGTIALVVTVIYSMKSYREQAENNYQNTKGIPVIQCFQYGSAYYFELKNIGQRAITINKIEFDRKNELVYEKLKFDESILKTWGNGELFSNAESIYLAPKQKIVVISNVECNLKSIINEYTEKNKTLYYKNEYEINYSDYKGKHVEKHSLTIPHNTIATNDTEAEFYIYQMANSLKKIENKIKPQKKSS